MTTVFVVKYDSGMYGSGVEKIFASENDAYAYVEKRKGEYSTYEVEKIKVE